MLVGSTFGVWTGAFACPGEQVALLCCLATGGYHSTCCYQWSCNDNILTEDHFAIAFVTSCGSYSCKLTLSESDSASKEYNFCFKVQGIKMYAWSLDY